MNYKKKYMYNNKLKCMNTESLKKEYQRLNNETKLDNELISVGAATLLLYSIVYTGMLKYVGYDFEFSKESIAEFLKNSYLTYPVSIPTNVATVTGLFGIISGSMFKSLNKEQLKMTKKYIDADAKMKDMKQYQIKK